MRNLHVLVLTIAEFIKEFWPQLVVLFMLGCWVYTCLYVILHFIVKYW